MRFAADLHIHSHYSRATSPRMNIVSLDQWARVKGIKVMGTGDFTHPAWFAELQELLDHAERGLFALKNSKSGTRFLLTAEISCIYSKGNRVRKVHIVIFAPSFEVVETINSRLAKVGNLTADGRPILGLDARELARMVLDASPDCMVIPAHAMTPWFGVFGSKSGFDSLEECFGDHAKYIYAIETGLSADPAMLWRIPDGRNVCLLSNSDAHSPEKIGREVNIFDCAPDYFEIMKAIKEKDAKKFLYTIEFFPEEGKYHLDGHRSCGMSLTPRESMKTNGLCPKCNRPLTIGVLSRIQELATESEGYKPAGAIPYKNLVPLQEIIADVLGVMVANAAVKAEYAKLVKAFGSEFSVLLGPTVSDLESATTPEIAQGIVDAREGKVELVAGYDGVFGHVSVRARSHPVL
ncbi:MAG: endonuclease Q family protein [Candidatus Nealsonbacteria bacterium DGGOD1a]|nr:MAG: endonuclease Q family protein [Candidatus Nealsonbacteria bacterium DGGOD1a]